MADNRSTPDLKSHYLVISDDPLLAQERTDQIRQQARAGGFCDRLVFEADSNWNSNRFATAWSSQSLFASGQLVEIRCLRPADTHVLQSITLCFDALNPSNLLLVTHPFVKKKELSQSWIQRFTQQGQLFLEPVPEGTAFRTWLNQRLHQHQLQLSAQASDWLILATEGNLLASAQAIDLLSLLYGKTPIGLEQVQDALSNVSRHNAFALVDACLSGDLRRALSIREQLLHSAEPPLLVLHAFCRELRSLLKARTGMNQGLSAGQALTKAGVWSTQITRLTPVLLRLPGRQTELLLNLALQLDRSIKGRTSEHTGDLLLRLIAALAGTPLLRHTIPVASSSNST